MMLNTPQPDPNEKTPRGPFPFAGLTTISIYKGGKLIKSGTAQVFSAAITLKPLPPVHLAYQQLPKLSPNNWRMFGAIAARQAKRAVSLAHTFGTETPQHRLAMELASGFAMFSQKCEMTAKQIEDVAKMGNTTLEDLP